MRKFLADTHVIIYFLTAPDQLGLQAGTILSDPKTEVYISVVSWWEIAIKIGLGKLSIGCELKDAIEICTNLGFKLLPLEADDMVSYVHLPLFHRDPFDRMLINQAENHNLLIISQDSIFDQYITGRIW